MAYQQNPNSQIVKLQAFGFAMIERYLNSARLRYSRPENDFFMIEFGYKDEWGCALTFVLSAEGDDESIYTIKCFSDRRIPMNSWVNALVLCNTWNNEWRYPRATLYIQDPEKSTTGNMVLDFHVPIKPYIHQEFIDAISGSIIASCMRFWRWATIERGF